MPRYVGGALAKSFSALLSVSQTPQASGIPTHSHARMSFPVIMGSAFVRYRFIATYWA